MDWSSLHAQQHLGAPPSLAALAVGSFVVAMTASRFAVDRVAHAMGPVWVLSGGAVLAMVGILTVIVGPNLPIVLVGWALFGVGLAGAYALTRSMKALIFVVSVADPTAFATVTSLLAAVALLACCIPAWRAARVDPLVALRHD